MRARGDLVVLGGDGGPVWRVWSWPAVVRTGEQRTGLDGSEAMTIAARGAIVDPKRSDVANMAIGIRRPMLWASSRSSSWSSPRCSC